MSHGMRSPSSDTKTGCAAACVCVSRLLLLVSLADSTSPEAVPRIDRFAAQTNTEERGDETQKRVQNPLSREQSMSFACFF